MDDEFIAGYFDGDGHIGLVAIPSGCVVLKCSISQSYNSGIPPELEYIRNQIGGHLRLSKPRKGNVRDQWVLDMGAVEFVEKIAKIVIAHGIMRRAESEIVLDWINNRTLDPVAKITLAIAQRDTMSIDSTRLTPSYLAGFFSANGSVFMTRDKTRNEYGINSIISKKGCLPILIAIRDKLGYGNINEKDGRILFSAMPTNTFLTLIRPYLLHSQKTAQTDLVLKYRLSRKIHRGVKRTREERDEEDGVFTELKRLKKL